MSAANQVENFFIYDLGGWLEIKYWPRWLRRAFILTLPLSGLLYVIAFILMMFCFCLGVVAGTIIDAWIEP